MCFIDSGPVPPEYFIGRQRELKGILNRLTSPRPEGSQVVGMLGMGKTSLLHYLLRYLENLQEEPVFVPVYWSCADIRPLNYQVFWRRILEETLACPCIHGSKLHTGSNLEKIDLVTLEKLVGEFAEQKVRWVLLLDEFQSAVKIDLVDLLDDLYYLCISTHMAFAVVAASSTPLARLWEIRQIPKEVSPLPGLLATVHLPPFSRNDLNELVSKVLGKDVEFTSDDYDCIWDTTDMHPQLVQMVGNILLDAHNRNLEGEQRYQFVTEQFDTRVQDYCSMLWHFQEHPEQRALQELAITARPARVQDRFANELETLIKRGLVDAQTLKIFPRPFSKFIEGLPSPLPEQPPVQPRILVQEEQQVPPVPDDVRKRIQKIMASSVAALLVLAVPMLVMAGREIVQRNTTNPITPLIISTSLTLLMAIVLAVLTVQFPRMTKTGKDVDKFQVMLIAVIIPTLINICTQIVAGPTSSWDLVYAGVALFILVALLRVFWILQDYD